MQDVWHAQGMRRSARLGLVAAAVIATALVVVLGLRQAGDDTAEGRPLSRAEVLAPLEGAPPQLAALHRRAGELVPGGPRALDAELRRLRGRAVVVNLWASWCGPCRFELPFLQAQASARGREIAFLGVNVDDEEAGARALLRELPVPYPSVQDPGSRILQRLRGQGLPGTAFYDVRGKLRMFHQGVYPTEAALADDIERYAG